MSKPEPDLVDLQLARTPFEAQVIAGVLEDAHIAAFVEGGARWDEFAVAQRLMNVTGVKLLVRRADLDKATKALAAARASGSMLTDDVEVEGDTPSSQ